MMILPPAPAMPEGAAEASSLYDSSSDARRHRSHMEYIAGQVQRPLPEVRALYEDLLGRLRPGARVKDYLPVIIGKQIREICRRQPPPSERR